MDRRKASTLFAHLFVPHTTLRLIGECRFPLWSSTACRNMKWLWMTSGYLTQIMSCLLPIVTVIGPIHGHERHDVIQFFHGVDMKGDIVKCPCPGVSITHVFVLEMGFDGIKPYILLGPVSPLFDQSTGKYSLLPQLVDPLENTKPTVEDHNKTLVVDW